MLLHACVLLAVEHARAHLTGDLVRALAMTVPSEAHSLNFCLNRFYRPSDPWESPNVVTETEKSPRDLQRTSSGPKSETD